MRPLGVLAFALFGLFGPGAENINFDRDAPNELPPYWTAAQTHSGPPGEWVVRRDAGAPSRPNVFSQVSRLGARYEFHLAVFDRVVCRNGELSVKFRIRPGPGAKTAGLIFRYQDPKNYYMVHFSAEERNVVLFRVQNARVDPIPVTGGETRSFGVRHDVRAGVWYLAKVVYRGSRFRVVLGNRLLFEADDDAIPNAGKTGLWTMGSTMASFDDFQIDKKS